MKNRAEKNEKIQQWENGMAAICTTHGCTVRAIAKRLRWSKKKVWHVYKLYCKYCRKRLFTCVTNTQQGSVKLRKCIFKRVMHISDDVIIQIPEVVESFNKTLQEVCFVSRCVYHSVLKDVLRVNAPHTKERNST